ncbi:hypothetical protein ACJIZ3_006223 [Penstemon smallii]|uniref:F-box domain-containing protein n=1 Tax=Penstemon smallii TaxID=265156 RepID=A0ABD3S7J1_9LAMI
MYCKKAGARIDFLQYLETDISLYIMSLLHDPADLVRASSVSHFWQQFVIENGFAKELCLKTLLGCSNFLGTVNESKGKNNSLETDHQVYAALLYAFTFTANKYPSRNIAETRNIPNILPIGKLSNWFSTGQRNAHVPETFIYILRRRLYVFTEIKVKHLPAIGSPEVFSAKSVRFRIGHAKSPRDNALYPITDEKVEWTYTSPEFPVKQEHKVQLFKLPQPVLCLGGYLKIEFLGRVQRHQKMDCSIYGILSYLQALGHRLFPAFEAKIHERYGKSLLMYNPDKLGRSLGRVFKALY